MKLNFAHGLVCVGGQNFTSGQVSLFVKYEGESVNRSQMEVKQL
jgi:hypothetical protein